MKTNQLLLALALITLPASGQTIQKFNDSISSGGGRSAAVVIGAVNYYVTSSVGEIAAPPAPAGSIVPVGPLSVESGFIATLSTILAEDPAADNAIPDGIADIWENRYGITTFVPTNDLDKDGLPDLLEAAFNLNPGAPDAAQAYSQSFVTDSGEQYLQLVFRKNKYHTGISLVPNRAAGLAPLDWSLTGMTQVSVTPIDAETDQVTVRSNTPLSSAQKQFMRLKGTYTPPAP